MKKVYEKPQMLIENFRLTEYIASCGGELKVNLTERLKCTAQDSRLNDVVKSLENNPLVPTTVFTTGFACKKEWEDLETGDGFQVCYHTSQRYDANVFNS